LLCKGTETRENNGNAKYKLHAFLFDVNKIILVNRIEKKKARCKNIGLVFMTAL
jgi:hypothetical protein